MKKHIIKIVIIAILFTSSLQAQLNIDIALISMPPSYLSDWGSGRAGQLIVRNTFAMARPILSKIVTRIESENGEAIAVSKNATAQSILINVGVNVLGMDKALQLENLTFVGKYNSLATSGKLLPGIYFLSLDIIDAASMQTVAKVTRKMFTQVNYQLPFLLSPAEDALLNSQIAQTAIIFRWSSLVPTTVDIPTYRLQVFEILSEQTPLQALRSNRPILLTDVRATTQYIWRSQLYLNDTLAHKFIWTIQTLDFKGNLINQSTDNSDSRSEPRVFEVKSMIPALKPKIVE